MQLLKSEKVISESQYEKIGVLNFSIERILSNLDFFIYIFEFIFRIYFCMEKMTTILNNNYEACIN